MQLRLQDLRKLPLLAVCLLHTQGFAQIDWQPSRLKVDSAAMDDGLSSLHRALAADARIRGVVVVQQGHLRFEYYRPDLGAQTLHDAASVTKSVLSSLIGIATHTHQITTDTPLGDLLPQIRGTATEPGQTTQTTPPDLKLWHLLTFSTGFAAQSRDRSGDYLAFKRSLDSDTLLQNAWDRPRSFHAGAGFTYNNLEPHLLSMALTQRTKLSAADFARQYLFGPLEITRFEWPGRHGYSIGSADLKLTSRDMAKLGQLWLQNGQWQGQSIIPQAYLEQATKAFQLVPSSGILGKLGYGYLFWVVLPDQEHRAAFFASGHGGQLIYVIPSLQLVVAVNAESQDAQHAIGATRTATLIRQHLLSLFEETKQ